MVNTACVGGGTGSCRPKPLTGGSAKARYVSPTGNMVAEGTMSDPTTLTEILKPGAVQPGSIVYLREGTYGGNFTCAISGAAGKKTVIRPYPGETAIIDGSFTITGNYLRLIGTD